MRISGEMPMEQWRKFARCVQRKIDAEPRPPERIPTGFDPKSERRGCCDPPLDI